MRNKLYENERCRNQRKLQTIPIHIRYNSIQNISKNYGLLWILGWGVIGPYFFENDLTYIIRHYNPSVRIINLVSHTTYVVCVSFIHKWRDLQFKLDSERQIVWETFVADLITLTVFARNVLRENRRRNTFRILFWCLT